jgi:ABC-type sugar transport system permease subunit
MTAVTKAPQPTRSRPLRKPPTQAAANRRALWFLLLPSLVPVVLFSVYPLLNGIWLGASDGFEKLHSLLELPFGSTAFLWDAAIGASNFQRNPIYATLHESSYADGVATRWSAARTKPAQIDDEGLFAAEHIYPEMWQDFGGLRAQAAAAQILAEYEWPRLYDADALRQNAVPVAASIYVNDVYVDRDFARETAATIRGLKFWETDQFEHNGVRADGERVFGTLFDLIH